MAVKLPHAPMIVTGLLLSLTEKTNYETQAAEGYRAVVVGSNGGAVNVNFPKDAILPFAPIMNRVVWEVIPGEYDVDGSKGMSVKFTRAVDLPIIHELAAVLEEIEAAYPNKATAKA